jgi:hypothetical protein
MSMNTISLPESLVAQLQAFEHRLRRMETLAAIAGGAVGVLAAFLVLFVSDRFGDTPGWARFILMLAGGGLAAWFAQGWAQRWLWNRRGPRQLAKLLQRHFRTLGDRLQGIIELTETEQLPANISPALMRAAIRQVADESSRFDFAGAVPERPARRWALVAIILAVFAAAPFVFVPKAATNAFARWLMPWANIERYTFAGIDKLPNELVVPHGETFEVACGLKSDSAWKPDSASARLNRREPQTTRIQEGRAVFQINGQTQDGLLTVRIGDATRDVRIRPMHRPEMKQLSARVSYPDYLGYPPAEVPLQGSTAEFLEGSKITFVGRTSRGLMTASVKGADPEPIKKHTGLGLLFKQFAEPPLPPAAPFDSADVSGDTFVTTPKPVGEFARQATFQWADTHGLTPIQAYTLRLNTARDNEPRVELQGLEQETAILPHEIVKVKLASADDYGLKEAWFGWTVKSLGAKGQPLGRGEASRTVGAHTRKELTAAAEFSPVWHEIPEDSVIELAAYAVDYVPNRAPIESWKHTVYVLSPAKHAERVRERMDQVLKDLDERIRDEERQLEETTAISQNKEQLSSERAGEDIKRVEAGERANQEMLKKLTEEMRSVMQDALRNKDIPEGTVADWQQLTEQLDQKASPPMQQAAQSLQSASQQPQNREPQLGEAKQQQQAALDAMRQAANRMNTTNQNLYARNFYNRLRAAAAAEHKVSDGLKGLAKETVGLRPDEIADSLRKDFDQVAGRQDETTKDVNSIVVDMAAFLKRVPNDKYETVHKEMQEKKVVAELAELGGFVRANLGLKSVGRAKQWGQQLDDWATMLQSECKSQGGGGEMDPDLLELIVAMVRAAQAEDTIREQTVLLDGRREANQQHPQDAKKLATLQDELRDSVGQLREKTKFDDVKPVLEKVEDLMDEVARQLRKANTSVEVVGTEAAVIELLVPPDKKGGKGSMAQMQQKLQQMMAQATKGRSGGGNNQKSSSAFGGDRVEGAAGFANSNERSVEKTGGAASAGEWPEEFRDQLQSFLQAVEEK